jgi:hypothetical protein
VQQKYLAAIVTLSPDNGSILASSSLFEKPTCDLFRRSAMSLMDAKKDRKRREGEAPAEPKPTKQGGRSSR